MAGNADTEGRGQPSQLFVSKVSLWQTVALVVSILAIAISVVTFWYVRRQAVAAERQAIASQALVATDTQRHHTERNAPLSGCQHWNRPTPHSRFVS